MAHVQEPAMKLKNVLCKNCHTHISDDKELAYVEEGYRIGFFKNANNLEVGEYWKVETDSVMNMHCFECNTLSSTRFIRVPVPSAFVRPGMFLLFLDRRVVQTGDVMLEGAALIPLPTGGAGAWRRPH